MNYLFQGLALGITAAAAPGTFQTYLIHQTLAHGWRRGAVVAMAPLLSDPPIILLILLVLNQLPPLLIQAIGIAGGLFALYLAWGIGREWRAASGVPATAASADQPVTALDATHTWGALGRGALINLLSPGPYLFWSLVCGPLLLEALHLSPLYGASFLLGFYIAFIGGMLALAALFHQARRLGARAVRLLTLASLVILAGFGMLLIAQGISGLT
jgi:threonine/homoserine/homoserine lactone efflux protein